MAQREPRPLTSKYEHWTDGVKLNKSFMHTLFDNTRALRSFTNQQAYMFYWLHHQQVSQVSIPKLDDPFMQMNVRNQLCKLEHMGLLNRLRPGTYSWTSEGRAAQLNTKAL